MSSINLGSALGGSTFFRTFDIRYLSREGRSREGKPSNFVSDQKTGWEAYPTLLLGRPTAARCSGKQCRIGFQLSSVRTERPILELLVGMFYNRGSTGSVSSARTPKTHSWTRRNGSRRTKRSRASTPRANSRRAKDRFAPRLRERNCSNCSR
jgi:hypothetical protein